MKVNRFIGETRHLILTCRYAVERQIQHGSRCNYDTRRSAGTILTGCNCARTLAETDIFCCPLIYTVLSCYLSLQLLEVREGEEAEVEEILQSAGNYRPHRHEGEAVARGNQRLPREILQSTGNHRPHRHEGEAVARGNQQSPRGRGGGRGRTGDSC